MSLMLTIAAFLAVALGVAHSLLGELYLLRPLFARGGLGDGFRDRTLRLAWHLTSVAWWGFAGILLFMVQPLMSYREVAYVIGLTFMTSALLTAIGSRGRHLAWPAMAFIGVVGLVVARG